MVTRIADRPFDIRTRQPDEFDIAARHAGGLRHMGEILPWVLAHYDLAAPMPSDGDEHDGQSRFDNGPASGGAQRPCLVERLPSFAG